jgi:glucoamylase
MHGDDYELSSKCCPIRSATCCWCASTITGPYRLVVIVAPHLGSTGRTTAPGSTTATVCAARRLLHVPGGRCAAAEAQLRLRRRLGWLAGSGSSRPADLWFSSAENGTVALTARRRARAASSRSALPAASGAFTRARTALAAPFDVLREEFLQDWNDWGARLRVAAPDDTLGDAGLLSAAVLKIHEDRAYPGAVVASLSVPWGNSTDTLGGYHLVWPRDATLTAFALLAANQLFDARHILAHLTATQRAMAAGRRIIFPAASRSGSACSWMRRRFRCCWRRSCARSASRRAAGHQEHGARAVGFIARTGPSSPQDRWEENPGRQPVHAGGGDQRAGGGRAVADG